MYAHLTQILYVKYIIFHIINKKCVEMRINMKKIGIVVCNYNKREFVIPCLESIFKSETDDFDVCVVDNASTDDSAEYIQKEFGDRVHLIVNEKNLGGSGGFNTGLRYMLEKDYEYLMCVDNDVLMNEKTISSLLKFMEKNIEVGMTGSKICVMDEPERIQTYGATIDFETYGIHDLHRGCLDDDTLPKVQYCDYVPACSLMVRTEAVRKVGIMPEDNFIYWDDMEWGYRFGLASYKVAAISASSILHKGGKAVNPTTFQKYYMFRNRLNFFMKYVSHDRREHFVTAMLKELYRSVCACHLKKDDNMLRTFMYAYDDALHGVRGVAKDCKILPRQTVNRFDEVLTKDSKTAIVFDGNFQGLSTLKFKLLKMIDSTQITVVNNSDVPTGKLKEQYIDINVVDTLEQAEYDVLFQLCPHIFQTGDVLPGAISVDQWLNLLITDEDYVYGKNFETNQQLFILLNKDVWLECIRQRAEIQD